ncbi:MAG: tRNA 4-thiouridine(8) synthase ThiI [Planctomycetota bacterium]|nr:MAG: tRNA 4-thiouridine(8) synthase ThiI [Planctomycetota bacterium]
MALIAFVLHYHEIALKGKNRAFFENKLMENVRFALQDLPLRVERLQKIQSRLWLELLPTQKETPAAFWKEMRTRVQERLGRVPGLANFAFAHRESNRCLDTLAAKIWQTISPATTEVSSFAVETKRSSKNYPRTSVQINSHIGAYIQQKSGWKVDLTRPDLRIFLEIVGENALFYTEKIPGIGGLPIGVSAPVLCLISGGIDSPVAAYLMMKRGCPVQFLHFHSFPFTTKASVEKVEQIALQLCQHRLQSKLYSVPFGELQRTIVAQTPPPLRVILYRRFMMRIAEKLAQTANCKALLTGESIGQVASQTIENLTTIQNAVQIPILRPLVGLDKDEITRYAKKIGTYEISLEPHQDCCSYLMPAHPATRTTPEQLRKAENALDIEELVKRACQQVEILPISGQAP